MVVLAITVVPQRKSLCVFVFVRGAVAVAVIVIGLVQAEVTVRLIDICV